MLSESLLDGGSERSGFLTPRQIQRRVWCIVLALVGANSALLLLLLLLCGYYPRLVSPGVLALSFGLRHAVDADHIAAIDNVTRRLIQEGRQPLLTGLWFSLGHSSVVCLMSMAAVSGSAWVQAQLAQLDDFPAGRLIATGVSAGLLLTIGVANGAVACRAAAHHRRRRPRTASKRPLGEQEAAGASDGGEGEGEGNNDGDGHDHGHEHGGLITRCCPVLIRAVDAEWKMCVVGFLFGLGFETSSEVALLALAALSPTNGIPPAATLVLPLLFAGAMSLVDTLDGLMMYWAYGFAVTNPGGRQLYNLYLTAVSSLIAVAVGTIELLGCLQRQLALEGGFWEGVERLNNNFEYVGYAIIGFFALSAAAALAHARCSQPNIDARGPIVLICESGGGGSGGSGSKLSGGTSSHAPKAPPVWWGQRRWG